MSGVGKVVIPPVIDLVKSIDHGQLLWKGQTQAGCLWSVLRGDAKTELDKLPSSQFDCVVTSPPYYWQRDYDVEGQIGKEPRIQDYVDAIVDVMSVVRRVMKKDGVLFLNLGDTYYSGKGEPKGKDRKNRARRFGLRAVDASGLGVPRKTIIGMPWRIAIAMINQGWTLRAPIVWRRTGSIPEPTAHDRPWRTHEMVFMFSRSPKYHFDRQALGAEEDIWDIPDRPRTSNGLHFAAFPDALVRRCLSCGCPDSGQILDPFAGTGTVLRVGLELGHNVTGIDINPNFCKFMAKELDQL